MGMLLSVCIYGREGLDGPEIGGEVRAGEIVVRNPAVTLDPQLWRLGVPEEDHPAFVIIVRAIKISQKINGYHRT
jgi:hypothetical protein